MSFSGTSIEGVRRRSLFAGGIGSLLWFVWLWRNVNFSVIEPWQWLIVIGGFVGFFLVGFALVRLVAWVTLGSMREKD